MKTPFCHHLWQPNVTHFGPKTRTPTLGGSKGYSSASLGHALPNPTCQASSDPTSSLGRNKTGTSASSGLFEEDPTCRTSPNEDVRTRTTSNGAETCLEEQTLSDPVAGKTASGGVETRLEEPKLKLHIRRGLDLKSSVGLALTSTFRNCVMQSFFEM